MNDLNTLVSPKGVNYLNTPADPKGVKIIHPQLAECFEAWLFNDGYQSKLLKHIAVARYFKTGKQSLEINCHGVMNTAAQKRYGVFLKQYLRLGKPMITTLRGQHPSYLKVAA